MICFCSNAECQTCPKFNIYHFDVGFVVAINSKRNRKLFQKLSRVAPILGLLETLIHENHGTT